MHRVENKAIMRKVPFEARLRRNLCAATKKITARVKLPPSNSRIITLLGISGIVLFFLAPCTGFHTFYRAVAAWHPQTTVIATYHYPKLQFDYVCTGHSATNATFTTHCASETTRGGQKLTTLSCDVSSVLLDQFLQLQTDGKCVVVNAYVANETVMDEKWDSLSIFIVSFAPVLQFVGLAFYFFAFLSALYYYPIYRRLVRSSPSLSAKALRIHALTPKWRTYFRCAAVFSCSLLVFHGSVFFLLTTKAPEDAFTSLFLGSLTALSPLLPSVYSVTLSNETFSVQLLSDFTVFEGVVINAEESERVRRQLEEDQRMERLKQREKDSRERLELLDLELD